VNQSWLLEGADGPTGVVDEEGMHQHAQRLFAQCIAGASIEPFARFANHPGSSPYLAAVAAQIAFEWSELLILTVTPSDLDNQLRQFALFFITAKQYLPPPSRATERAPEPRPKE
jgi:hypothetical protein